MCHVSEHSNDVSVYDWSTRIIVEVDAAHQTIGFTFRHCKRYTFYSELEGHSKIGHRIEVNRRVLVGSRRGGPD
jgi:hypothetical protein